jgi:ribosomal protein S18 acetylase RimI-like enzyme
MSIRLATITDASSLAALSLEVWLGTYIREGINGFFADYALEEFTTQKFEAILQNENERIYVSDNTVGIDGFIRISCGHSADIKGCSDTEITSLYVQPRHQGKHIGKRLLATGLEYCASVSVTTPWLAVNSENPMAINFYRANGFRKIGQTRFQIQDRSYLNEVLAIDLSLGGIS